MTTDVTTSKNLIEVDERLNNILVELKTSIVEASKSTNKIDISETLNYIEFLSQHIQVVVSNPTILLDVAQQAEILLELTPKENTLTLAQGHTSLISLQTQEFVIEILENPPPLQDEDEAKIMYKKRVDFVGDTIIYKGFATPGALETDPVWRLSRITIDTNSDDDVDEDFANGNDSFTNTWVDRASQSYG